MAENINQMDKASLWFYMKVSREAYRFNDELPAWKRAIELYRASGNKFDSDCTGCRRRLIEWMEKCEG